MSSYSSMERAIAKSLDAFPFLKKAIRKTYQLISYTLNREKGFKKHLHSLVNIKSVGSSNNNETFFGYYDKTPWSHDMRYYAYHEISKDGSIYVKICDSVNKKEVLSKEIRAYNFQQGSMLQWFSEEYKIGFNDVQDNKLVFVILDLSSGTEKVIPWPVQTINPRNTNYICINYKRLDKLRPEYGYTNLVTNFQADFNNSQDGIWSIDLESQRVDLIISLEQLLEINPLPSMENSQHKVNHVMFSPSGSKFIFMHRWLGGNGKFSRLYISDLSGNNLKILLDDRMVSHYQWLDESKIIVWGRKKEKGDKYFLINVNTQEFKVVGENILDKLGDGHPSFSPNGEWLITDTYPDKARQRHLILYNYKENKIIKLGRFFAPWKYDGEKRCDLHPRWSPDGKYISIDSAHEGMRRNYVIDVSKIVEKGRVK